MLEVVDGLEFHEALGAFHLGAGGGRGRKKAEGRQCQAHAGDSKEGWFHSFRYRFGFLVLMLNAIFAGDLFYGWSLSRSRWEWCLRLELAAAAHGYKERERKPVGLRFYHVSFDPLQVFIRRRTGNPSNYCGSRESSRVGWAVALQAGAPSGSDLPGRKRIAAGFRL